MVQRLEQQLLDEGMSPTAAAGKARVFRELIAALRNETVGRTLLAYHVPGRLEVLGKHTDYAGGRSIVAAVEQGFAVVAAARPDRVLSVRDLASNEALEFIIDADLQPMPGTWANYPMTVARRIARNFPGDPRGADIVLSSDLPPAAGMSSSSALMIACFKVLADVNELGQRDEYRNNITSDESLAAYLATIENGQSFGSLRGDHGVGTFGGSEDHTAILCSRAGRLSQYSFAPTRLEQTIRLPENLVFAIATSGVVAEKTGAAMEKYNLISRRASQILELWRNQTARDDATLAAAVRSSPDAPDRLRAMLRAHGDDALLLRLEQFIEESEQIIPAFADALARGDAPDATDAARRFAVGGLEVGELADRSQSLAETHLMNQIPETIALARIAREHGALAASGFGAGFGGSVWALIHKNAAADFLIRWQAHYRQHHRAPAPRARFFTTQPAPRAIRLLVP